MERNKQGVGYLPTVGIPLRDQLVPLSGTLKGAPGFGETHFRERWNRHCKMNSGLQKFTWRIKKETKILKKLLFPQIKIHPNMQVLIF